MENLEWEIKDTKKHLLCLERFVVSELAGRGVFDHFCNSNTRHSCPRNIFDIGWA